VGLVYIVRYNYFMIHKGGSNTNFLMISSFFFHLPTYQSDEDLFEQNKKCKKKKKD
jgi:hypothetical protein